MRRALTIALLLAAPALALDSPWISDTYFYWYQWDYARQWGGWEGGVYNTPLSGYYDSARFDDNLHQLHTASEWGVSHHFMDYWGPGWKGEGGEPREMTLVRATEALRAKGYPIYMSVYQDGTDFDMADFAKNVQPGRDTFFYLDLFGRHDSYAKLKGQPVALIYGRNGSPKVTAKDEGFRDYLQARYGDIGKLNRQWGTSYQSFSEVRLDFGSGFARYESIKYQYTLWELAWDQVNSAARARWQQPGVLCSWDVGFQPYQGWGFSDMCRVFVGTHSYGGIFDVPHSEGVERFIQAQVAKAYDTVFFDTYKNYYHDWEIRIPGICYPPDFNAFDRFWMQVLLNKSEALLHLSWNEWWEGSNLEPSLEYGKTYCEKNLLWASVLQQCFPSVHNWNKGARVAVLLNDWNWYVGGTHTADIYGAIQGLRRSGVTFDLLPDDFVDARALGRFDTIVAPTAGVGLGFNQQGQAILPLLKAWVEAQAGRKLALSALPDTDPASKLNVDAWLGLKPLPAATGATQPGGDMNVVVDVGVEGDEKFLVSGMSQREDWGKLPADSFGSQTGKHTVRWCPAVGKRTTFLLPFSAHRDHVLRFGGDALEGQTVTVVIDDHAVGTVAIKPGYNEYELAIPAAQIGGLEFAALHLDWGKAVIPSEVDPQRYPSENRVTNLAIEFVQLATAGTPKDAPVKFKLPESKLALTADFPGALKGKSLPADYTPHRAVQAGKVLSRYAGDRNPRDLLLPAGKGQIWYCNGYVGTVGEPGYFDAILDWAGAARDVRVEGDHVLGGTVSAGDTTVILAYNNDAPDKRSVSITRPARELPVSEVQVLSLDGRELPQLYPGQPGKRSDVKMTVPMAYYAALAVAYAPVRVDTPPLQIVPGEKRSWPVKLINLTSRPQSGTLGLGWHLPSISGTPLRFALKPNETKELMLTLATREDYDWGQKTIVLDLAVGGRHAYLWRGLTALRPAEMAMPAQVVSAKGPRVTAAAAPLTWHDGERPASDAPREVKLAVDDKVVERVAGAGAAWDVPAPATSSPGPLQAIPATLGWRTGTAQRELPVRLYAGLSSAKLPKLPGAVGVVAVYNPSDSACENAPVDVLPPGDKPAAWHLRDLNGSPVPSVTSREGDFTALVSLPARSSALYYLCQGAAPVTSDLRVEQHDLGTGHGTVTVRNSVHALTWSEVAGGTLTSWRELVSGRELAAENCGGIAYGQWGKFDPHKPAIGSLDYVAQEKRILQSATPGRIQVDVMPGGVEVRVEWKDAAAEAVQVYDCLAYNGTLTYHSQAKLSKPQPDAELVVADFHLRRNAWTKLFPDFTGIQSNADGQGGFDGNQPHAGWRQSPYTPPVASLLSPPGFVGSLSLLYEGGTGVDRYRQGFWPAKRPVAGPVDFAEVEYANTHGTAAAVTLRLLLHDGHQPVAEAYRRARDEEPLSAEVLDKVTWDGAAALPPAPPADWWHPAWHARAKLAVGPLAEDASDPVVSVDTSLQQRLGAPLDPDSLRLLVDGALVATAFDVTDTRLRFVLPGLRPKGATYQAEVYFDDQAHGPKLRLASSRPMPGLALTDPGFEHGGEGWGLPCGVVEDNAHSGRRSALLERREGDPATLLWTASPRVEPNSHYRVTCWARTTSPDAAVRSNLFDGAKYDYGQVALPVPPDGQWHQLTADLPAGSFPATAHPYLRFWLLGPAGKVWLDDVTFERLDGPAVATVPAVVVE